MALRRSLTFWDITFGNTQPSSLALGAELLALCISILMFAGIARLAPLFKTIERSTAALKQSDRIKGEIISTAAHELNTPLASILGYTEILLNPGACGTMDDERQKDFLREIYRRGSALSRILDSLLDLSRIESGQPIPLEMNRHDLKEVVRKQVDYFQCNHQTHRICFESTIEGTATVTCDLDKIIQVLENMLSNAVKYSPPGSHVAVSLEKEGQEVRLCVVDEGIGMSEEVLDHAFDTFYRADASNTAAQGLGLGMSLIKHIVEAHGGRVQIESAPKNGTKVSCFLPTSE